MAASQMVGISRGFLLASFALCGWLGAIVPSESADLGPSPGQQLAEPVQPVGQWQFSFTPYLWLPWMCYAEARRGPLSLFNDIDWADVSGGGGFSREVSGRFATATFAGNVKANYQLAIIETGGAYTVWSQGSHGSPGSTTFDLLTGARVWYQNVDISGNLTGTVALNGPLGITVIGSRAIAKSGSVDWADPFVGARIQQQLAPGQELVLRGDVGGFGAGSQFSWQAIATYNSPLCEIHGIPVDGYVGFRALYVDYSQGSGTSKFEFNNVIYGPVIGTTMRF